MFIVAIVTSGFRFLTFPFQVFFGVLEFPVPNINGTWPDLVLI
jgi:hypothetical protein